MSVNPDRPIITYENIALFHSDTPAHSSISNSGENIFFLPLVQSISFSVDAPRKNTQGLGSRNFLTRNTWEAPDINFSVNVIEHLKEESSLFYNLIHHRFIDDDDRDRNFYAVVGDKRGFSVSGESLDNRDVLSFGNCFLTEASLSQSINGVMLSSYNFVGSNMQAQQLQQNGDLFSGDAPSIDLTGDQSQDEKVLFSGIENYYSKETGKLIPYYSTHVTVSGNGSVGNFLIQSDFIQSFQLRFPTNRKTIYDLGKRYPVKRKLLFPVEGDFSFSNRVSNFEVNGERANLKDFLNSDESYTINISGSDTSESGFNFKITDAKFASQSYDSSIGSDISASLNFSFDINKFVYVNPPGSLFKQDGTFLLLEQGYNDNILLES